MIDLNSAFGLCPLVAIIRGAQPTEIIAIATQLYQAGVRIMEIPLNSPEPFVSINLLVKEIGDKMVIGAGTVLNVNDVQKVADAGGQLCVSPNTDVQVIRATINLGMSPMPGFLTATEAFAAIQAGANWLKYFPANSTGSKVIGSLRDVLPSSVKIVAVGGLSPTNVDEFIKAGCNGIGLAGSLYRPGMSATMVGEVAKSMVNAIDVSTTRGPL